MSKLDQGKKRIHEILGKDIDTVMSRLEKISPDFAKYIWEFGYGELYSRDGLEDKYREISAVSCLIGLGNEGIPLKAHLKGMLNVGWTKGEIIELLIFLTGYAGFPRIVNAMKTAQEVFDEYKK